ncbi:MAG: bifunctional glutamate N-acetyltransferase/amino-acid acetyltransferase ArgJ [Pseudomonadota bacterium]
MSHARVVRAKSTSNATARLLDYRCFEGTMLTEIKSIEGIRVAAVNVGIKQTERPDLCLIEARAGSTCASMFTQNKFAAAPVIIAKDHMGAEPNTRYLLINSGNANCGTGTAGVKDATALCEKVAVAAGCSAEAVLPYSTGVIGERLPVGKLAKKVDALFSGLSDDGWTHGATAIMTTDTRPKLVSSEFELNGHRHYITGMAKGSGMIKPNMATMLSFIATDASVPTEDLYKALRQAVMKTFNRITIDGDTSTNDAVTLFATGARGEAIGEAHPEWQKFCHAIYEVCRELAKELVADGEGATKLVEIEVSSDDAQVSEAIGYTVAESPLVKTALFASDPNWGRILAAIGRAPVEGFAIDEVGIFLDDYQIVAHGSVVLDYSEDIAAKIMAQKEIKIVVKIGTATEVCSILTSDLSYDYVRINAEYRS